MAKRKQADAFQKDVPSKVDTSEEATWSKSKKKRMRRLKGKQKKITTVEKKEGDVVAVERVVGQQPSNAGASAKNTSALQKSFMARLTGSRFRELNEVRVLHACKSVIFHHFLLFTLYSHSFLSIGTLYDDFV
jgi:hypothetical protein